MSTFRDWVKSFNPDRATSELEEQLYAMAAQEAALKDTKPGLMAKAFAEAEGERDRATALYIKLRVAQLREELSAEAEAARQFEAHRREAERKSAKQQRQAEAMARERVQAEERRKRRLDPARVEMARREERVFLTMIVIFVVSVLGLILLGLLLGG